MTDDIFKVFDAWTDLFKARKAKGLENWARLEHLAQKLAGKHSRDIVFTCAHPAHEGAGPKHVLGSVVGNLHFLMGYVNPGFCLAPYHWQILYPELDDNALYLFLKTQQHPAKPVLWNNAQLAVSVEGDQVDGKPHPYALTARDAEAVKSRSINAKSIYGTYTADPVTGLVYKARSTRVYKWDLVKNSVFGHENPEIAEAMELAKPRFVQKSVEIPESVKHLVTPGNWHTDVYPLVKSLWPRPGAVVTLPTDSETLYGLVRPASIVFVDAVGQPVAFSQYDRAYHVLDLTKGGDVHPSILYAFSVRYMGVDGRYLENFTSRAVPVGERAALPNVVNGYPSRGYEAVPAAATEGLLKSTSASDHTTRLVIQS